MHKICISLFITLLLFSCTEQQQTAPPVPANEVATPTEQALIKNQHTSPAPFSITNFIDTTNSSSIISLANKQFTLGRAYHFVQDECRFVFECDCCADNIIFLEDSNYITYGHCVSDTYINAGTYSIKGNKVTLTFNGIQVSDRYNWDNELDTSAVDYFKKDTILETTTTAYYGQYCDNNFRLAAICDSVLYYAIEDSESPSLDYLEEAGYQDRLDSMYVLTFQESDQEPDYFNQLMYIVVADSSSNYYQLKDKMLLYSKSTGIEIDSMGRAYESKSHSIKLPLDAPDEMYAGAFYPRRFTTDHLSIEPLSYYTNRRANQFGIVVQLTDSLEQAQSTLKATLNTFPHATIIEDDIYMGCMH